MNKRNKSKKKHQSNPKANRKYKDTLFCLAFKDKKDLLDLYNAVNHTEYQNVDELEVNTLQDAVYLSMKNDISFLIGGTMNLYEHQSSYNANMPIRGLIYFARMYEQYTQNNGVNLYSSALKVLPVPHYLVFYNGTKDEPDEVVLKLTDAFGENAARSNPCLECTATMLNINYGHNRAIMEKCRRLEEYAFFVKTVRNYVQRGHTLDGAITDAVDDCIEQGVLKDILMKNRTEVIGMILTSFRDEEYEKLMQEEWKELGLKAGLEEGRRKGLQEGRREGLQEGRREGLQEGRREGLQEGRREGLQEGRREGLQKGLLEGRHEGLQEGQEQKVLELICKKLRKGKSPETIAEELEEDLESIADICVRASALAPDYDYGRLYKLLNTEHEGK